MSSSTNSPAPGPQAAGRPGQGADNVVELIALISAKPGAFSPEDTTAALRALRNLAREAPLRRALAEAGAIPPLLALVAQAPGLPSEPGAGAGTEAMAAGSAAVAVAGAAVEVLVNLACLFENKKKIQDAGGIPRLVQAATVDPSTAGVPRLQLQEVALSCLGCLSFFHEPAASAALESGVLPAVLPLLQGYGGGADCGDDAGKDDGARAMGAAEAATAAHNGGASVGKAKAAAFDLIKNMMLVRGCIRAAPPPRTHLHTARATGIVLQPAPAACCRTHVRLIRVQPNP